MQCSFECSHHPAALAEPRGALVEPWWNPRGMLVEPYLRAAPDHPGAIWAETRKLSAVGRNKQSTTNMKTKQHDGPKQKRVYPFSNVSGSGQRAFSRGWSPSKVLLSKLSIGKRKPIKYNRNNIS